VSLPSVSIRRPVFAAMLTLGLVVLGLVSLSRIEMQMDPDLEFPAAVVVTALQGASPETVEREVTDPIEEQLNSIEGVHTLSSTSSQGISRIAVRFGLQYDVDVKAQEVRDKVALARPLLPLDVEAPVVQKFDLAASSVMAVVLGGPVSLRELSDLAEHEVKERIERLPGVGGVMLRGAREREVRIWLDPIRLAGYDLAIEEVSATLRSENTELASGRIEGATTEWSVTTQGKATDVAGFGEMVVAERGGRLVRLRDVATIEDGMAEARSIARFKGRPGVALEISRQSGADLVVLARAVRAEVAVIQAELPPGVEIRTTRDYPKYIEAQIRSVLVDMLFATSLVVIVVLAFLREWRSTFIASLTIPASLISCFTLLLALDLSLNTMTLIALSLAIGLVIDDAIVVLESIYRRIERREDPMRASFEGTEEVGLAVISTTLAVCAIFVPITFMKSEVGRYFYEFGVAVTAAVCISTLVALTLVPALASRLLRGDHEPGGAARTVARAEAALERAYASLLHWALRYRGVTLAAGLVAVIGGCGVASTLPFDLYNQEDLSRVNVSMELPIGTPLPVTNAATRRLEARIADHPEVVGIYAVAGSDVRHEPNRAQLDVILLPKSERSRHIEDTFADFRMLFANAVPEAKELSVGYPAYGDVGEFSDLQYSLQGPDLVRLERFASELVARMEADPIFSSARSSFESGRPQVILEVDRARAADLGLSTASIGRAIRTLLAGEKVGSFEEDGRCHDVRVQVMPAYRDDPEQLELVRLRSISGELVPLMSAVRRRLEEGPVEIRRRNRTREITLDANLVSGVPLGDGTAKVEAWGRELVRSPDTLVPGGFARTMNEMGADILFAFGLGFAALYMVLASLFNSFTHPITIMVSAPLSFIGGFLALKVSGMSLDMMSGIGLLVLMGLVMKNGILLVDYAKQLRERDDRSATDAMLAAGPVRMRPVLMTAFTLIFGLLPTVLSTGIGAEFRAPMAVITIGGLLTSTFLTLVIVPVVYCVIDAATQRARALARWRGKPAARRSALS
jgi:HAE1 family hydrophobic/amphiphilic exporter-1